MAAKFAKLFISIHEIRNKGQILIFKVSKKLNQHYQHDRIICKWYHCLPGYKKWYLKISSAI